MLLSEKKTSVGDKLRTESPEDDESREYRGLMVVGSTRPCLMLIALAICIAFWSISTRPSYADDFSQPQAVSVETFGLPFSDSDRRPPSIILIPGLSCGGDVWQGVVKALGDRYALHVVTLAGFAGSEPLPGEGPFLETVRDSVIAYIEDNHLHKPAIVGHSLGGFLAYWLGATVPDEVGAVVAVDGLPFLGALQDPAASAESLKPMADQMQGMFKSMTNDQFLQQNEMALRSMIRDSDEVSRIASTSGRSDPASVGKAVAELMTTDLRNELVKIKAPILQFGAFAGLPTEAMRDTMKERYVEQVSAAPRAAFVEAPTLHFVMLDDEDFFLKELERFFAESWPGAGPSAVRN